MIEVKQLSKQYEQHIVLDKIDLVLPKEQMIAFIGSNGAGKSTLLSIIGRTLHQNQGQVFLESLELSKWKNKDLAKRIAILHQSNSMTLRLSVEELVSFGRFPHSQGNLNAEDWVKIEEALSFMELEKLRHSYLDELSGGQRQMAFIAMVIAQDSEYIFLDEPLNNLDMKHSVQIMKILKRLVHELHKTVFVVIHDINFVSYYSDYIIALKDGKIVAEGKNEEVLTTSVLKEVYDIEIQIQKNHGKTVCLYYD